MGTLPASRLPEGPNPVASSGVKPTTPPTMGSPADAPDARGRSGDTLESTPAVALVHAPPQPVVVIEPPPVSDTLPSKDLPIFGRGRFRRGVPPGIVVGLVAMALVAGFLIGWALARMS
jgi:hypothetical protein